MADTPAKFWSTNPRQRLVAAGAILAILASAFWIYRTEFAAPGVNRPLHEAVGQVLAEETVRIVGHTGKVVIVTVDTRTAPELKVQVQAFEQHLKSLSSLAIKDKVVLDPGDNPKYRPGSGLSTKRFLKIVRKHPGVDAIVSFVGAPPMTESEITQVKSTPKFIAETHSPERLAGLFVKQILNVAIVPRYQFPAPGPKKPQTDRQWFDRYFQLVKADTLMPAEDASP